MFLSAMASKLGVENQKKDENEICTNNEKMYIIYIYLQHYIHCINIIYIYICLFLVGQNQQRINQK